MFLKYLFAQYDTRTGPTFASRFMKVCGNLVMGTPTRKGFGHLRQDLQDSYYYIKEDRKLPTDPDGLQKWQVQSIFVAQYRELEAPQISKAACLWSLPIVMACVFFSSFQTGSFASAANPGASAASDGASSTVEEKGWFSSLFSREDDGSITFSQCKAMATELMAGQTTIAEIPNFKAKEAECIRLGGLPENQGK